VDEALFGDDKLALGPNTGGGCVRFYKRESMKEEKKEKILDK